MRKDNNLPIYSLQTFISPERKSQQFQVEVFNTKRHYEVKYPHRHDFFEVLYLANGSGFIIIDNNRYEIQPPCVFFLSPGQAHKLELSEDIGGYIFIFTDEFYLINKSDQNRLIEFPFFYTILQNNPPLRLNNEHDNKFIEGLFERAICEISEAKNPSIEFLRSILDLVLTLCSVLYPIEYDFKTTGKGALLVKKFYKLLEENIHKNLLVNQYAEMLAVTPNHLTQTLKFLTGKTSNDIIKEKQVLEIKRLLVHTNLNVTEIADQLNFTDQSYFSKFFKRETGVSPIAYRIENQN
jgi:AraC-like DNA-binding protein/mannose-6-phosphate isomerase-like protein (cupin superfamily)